MKRENSAGFYLIVGILALMLSSLPYLYGWLKSPPGFVYTGLTTNIDDCMVYLSWIREYGVGRFVHRNLFTTEEQHPILFYAWFWILGLVSKVIGPIGAFHVGRVLGGAGLLAAIAWLLRLTLGDEKTRRYAFAIACFASGLGWMVGSDAAKKFVAQPIDLDVPEAITFLSLNYSPLFAPMTALIVVFFCSLVRSQRSGKLADLWPGALAGAVLGNSHTYDVVPIFLAAGSWQALKDIHAKSFNRQGWIRIVVLGIAALPTTAINVLASRTDPLFKARVWANQPTWTPLPWWVFLGWGIPFLLAIFGSYRKNRSRFADSSTFWMLVSWAIAHLISSYLPGVPVQRKFLMGAYIPICALAGVGLTALLAKLPGDLPKALGPLTVGLCALSNLLALTNQLGQLDSNSGDTASRPYLSLNECDALDWISKNATDGAVLVSVDPSAIRRFPGRLLPHLAPQVAGIAHRTVFDGHWSETLDYTKKIRQTTQFFQVETDDAIRKDLAGDGKIGYLLYVNSLADGPPTTLSGEPLNYNPVQWIAKKDLPDWLEIAYQNPEITVLKINL